MVEVNRQGERTGIASVRVTRAPSVSASDRCTRARPQQNKHRAAAAAGGRSSGHDASETITKTGETRHSEDQPYYLIPPQTQT